MTALRNARMLMRYTAWADERLYAALADVPAALLHEPRPGRAAGVMGTLGHIHAVDLIWKAHLEGCDHGLKARALETMPTFDELRGRQHAIDRWYCDFVDGQHEASLAEVIAFRFVDGGAGALSRGDMLLHIANHKTYHRGYVADMLYESGLRPPTMDLPVFLRDAPPALD